jgi:signal transduction histidine kinase
MVLLANNAAAETGMPTLVLKADRDIYELSEQMGRYIEAREPLAPFKAWQYFQAGKFSSFLKGNNEFYNDGLLRRNTWLGITLVNPDKEARTIVFEFILSGSNNIQCYLIDEQQELHLLPAINQPLHSTRLSYTLPWEINAAPYQTLTLLFKLENKGAKLNIPVYARSLDAFNRYSSSRNNFLGIFQGLFLFIILFNGLLFLITHERIYGYYMAYALFISLYSLNEAGSFENSLANAPIFGILSGTGYLFAGFAAWLLLMRHFLSINHRRDILGNITLYVVLADILMAVLPIFAGGLFGKTGSQFQSQYQQAVTVAYILNLILIIVANIVSISTRNKLTVIYALANIPVIFGTLIYYSNQFGYTHFNTGWISPLSMGLSIEAFAIAFAFVYRYSSMQKEKLTLLSRISDHEKNISQQLITAQESEQKRIAQDLHDEIGGNLAAIKMTLESFRLPREQADTLGLLIDKASYNARNIAHNLMPPEFEKTALKDLLEKFYSKLNNESQIQFQFQCNGETGLLNKQQELIVYRILQELTNNICKHSLASEASVQLIYYQDNLEIMVEDNGRGFNTTNNGGMGLRNIRSRIDFLRGQLSIDSSPRGSTIILHVPYQNTPQSEKEAG